MMEKLMQEAMKRGMKIMSNPTVMRFMADPRFMTAISKGFQIKAQIQEGIDSTLHSIADKLNLATKRDVETLQRSISHVESTLSSLHRKANGKS
ncbi:MAG: hypothetical protein V1754_09740 [Pseudomonadota bacterium]